MTKSVKILLSVLAAVIVIDGALFFALEKRAPAVGGNFEASVPVSETQSEALQNAELTGETAAVNSSSSAAQSADPVTMPTPNPYTEKWSGFLGMWYENTGDFENPLRCNTVNIQAVEEDAVQLSLVFYHRMWSDMRAEMRENGALYFSDETAAFSGILVFSDNSIVLTIDNTPGFYNGMSSTEFLGGAVHKFTAREKTASNWPLAYRDFVLNELYLERGDQLRGYDEENVSFSLVDMDNDGTPELLIYNGFNGRNLHANYVFSFNGTDIVYCGSTQTPVFSVSGYPGLFASVTMTGASIEDQYAGIYSEVTYLNHYTLSNGSVQLERVSVTGTSLGSADRTVLYQSGDEKLLEASKRTPVYPDTMTYHDILTDTWDAVLEMYA